MNYILSIDVNVMKNKFNYSVSIDYNNIQFVKSLILDNNQFCIKIYMTIIVF